MNEPKLGLGEALGRFLIFVIGPLTVMGAILRVILDFSAKSMGRSFLDLLVYCCFFVLVIGLSILFSIRKKRVIKG